MCLDGDAEPQSSHNAANEQASIKDSTHLF